MALLILLHTGCGMARYVASRQTSRRNGVSLRLTHVWTIQRCRLALYEAQAWGRVVVGEGVLASMLLVRHTLVWLHSMRTRDVRLH